MIITINTHDATSEEIDELREYLDNNAWDYREAK